jgi:hypothetical protein
LSGREEADIIRAYFAAYESKDRAALEQLLGDDFTFSSPHDDRIGKPAYFAKCWPFSESVQAFHLARVSGTPSFSESKAAK